MKINIELEAEKEEGLLDVIEAVTRGRFHRECTIQVLVRHVG